MQKILDLKNEFYEKWVSPNGLALLGEKEPENANGILFLAMFMLLVKEIDLLNQRDLDRSFDTLSKIRKAKGYYKRSPTQEALEAQDNYVGVCALSVLFNLKDAREIVEVGTENGFAFDHSNPHNPDPRSIRQGGDIAFYKICAGYSPTIWEHAWLCIGLCIGGWKGSPSDTNLAWTRLKTLSYALPKMSTNLFGWLNVSIFFTSLVYNMGVRKRFGGIQGSFAKYFIENHPIRRLAKELSL